MNKPLTKYDRIARQVLGNGPGGHAWTESKASTLRFWKRWAHRASRRTARQELRTLGPEPTTLFYVHVYDVDTEDEARVGPYNTYRDAEAACRFFSVANHRTIRRAYVEES